MLVGIRSSEPAAFVAAPPAAGAMRIDGGSSSSTLLRKAIVRPSGDQTGERLRPAPLDTRVSSPPPTGIVQTSLVRPSSYSRPVLSETKAIRAPSGDHCGSLSFQSSPLVS